MSAPKENQMTWYGLDLIVAGEAREAVEYALMEAGALAVVVEKWDEEREDFTRIHCAIFVERGSQKKIVISKGAARLKEIGIQARHDIEACSGIAATWSCS